MRIHKEFRFISIFPVITTALTMGCFTSTALMRTSSASLNNHREVIRDNIIAIGQPKTNSNLQIDGSNQVVFIGDKNSYYLVDGGNELFSISKNLDGNKISINPNNPSLYTKGDQIWGSIILIYSFIGSDSKSSTELAKVQEAGFLPSSMDNSRFEKRVEIKGLIGPKINIPESLKQSLKVSRQICFYTPPINTATPAIKRVAIMPIAIAADVVTSPIQLIGFTCLLFTKHP